MPTQWTTYPSVLLLVIVTYAVSLAVDGLRGAVVAAFLQVATVSLSLRHSGAGRRIVWLSIGLLVIATVAVVGVALAPSVTKVPPTVAAWAVYLLNTLLYVIAPVSILRDVASSREVNGDMLVGSVAAYLQIGILFAFIYRLIDAVTPSFSTSVDTGDLLFFSFVSLSTTGYGDVVPIGWAAETASVVEIVIGQFFLVAAVGKIVTAWVPRGRER
ncbi:MAG: ion channel [Pseudonocardia sp.]